ncbi:F-box/kelch-repeat protein At3g23880-like [Quercus robur]|uniref:F-box/kelch-repeat protein At3g23880-like n=1 Tax=Quercus robur TaxID=38942 RepID=UPI0021627050|nr:F-box/kelch-repeat protein At3g23880-like [Quercus robur]
MSQNTTTTTCELLPEDVLEDILGHLPVKSLTRFRCVSKSCDSIIIDPTFITKHLKLNLNQSESLISTNTHSGYLLYTTEDKNSSPSSKQLCTVVCNNDRTLTQVSRFEMPSCFDECYIVGCCNGLFCIADDDLSHIIYLWNPSIRIFKKLLATPFTDEDTTSIVGLAYNSQNNDFKILRIVSFYCRQEAKAEIYSLSTDSWRKVVISMESLRGYEPNFGKIRRIDPPCIFLNGALHTVAITSSHRFILSFNVNDESFREIMLPPNHLDLDSVYVCWTELAVFKGSLAVFIYTDYHWVSSVTYGLWRSMTATGLVSIDPESRNQNILAIEDADWYDTCGFEKWGTIGDEAADFRLSAFGHFENSKADGFKHLQSRINPVDLAGSEQQKLNDAAGPRLKQTGNISRSLS